MSLYEAEAYMRGVGRRDRAGWEQARFVAYSTMRPWCKNLKLEDMARMPWESGEQASDDEEVADEEILKRIPEIEKRLKGMKNGRK